MALLPGYATAEGTARYAKRFEGRLAAGQFRNLQSLKASSIGLGTYLGDPDDTTDRLYREAVIRAVELGCNVVDTAINYRFQRSERAIRKALLDLLDRGYRRDELVIATKGGFIPFDHEPPLDPSAYFITTFVETGIADFPDRVAGCHIITPRYILNQIETSRRNLGLDCIDIYYLHNPETQLQEISRDAFLRRIQEVFGALEGAVSEGKIRLYGTATWNGYRSLPKSREYLSLAEMVRSAQDVGGPNHHFRTIQLPYNLMMPEAYTIENQTVNGRRMTVLEAAGIENISVVSSAAVAQRRLTQGLPDWLRQSFPALSTDAQRSVQYVRSTPGIGVALVGMKQKAHVEENLATAQFPPATPDQIRQLSDRGSS
jgi:aryl-alcohol dehydrogenase-like predicted oxidoreductase